MNQLLYGINIYDYYLNSSMVLIVVVKEFVRSCKGIIIKKVLEIL